MARDYKYRADNTRQTSKRQPAKANKRSARATKQTHVAAWRWGLVIGLVGLFAYFLYSLSLTSTPDKPTTLTKPLARQQTKLQPKKATKPATNTQKDPAEHDIIYDFYTVLPNREVTIADHEVKTRKREERVGKEKPGVKYSVQAGSFRHHKDADRLKAKLLMMGFSPKIEKAVIGSATWYRVKMGPYNKIASVDAIQSRLKSNNMDAMVIEIKK